jgi:hypothetical protein
MITHRSRVLRAALAFVVSWMFAGAAPAFAQITFNVYSPEAGSTQGEPVPIAVSVASATEVQSVTATAGGRSVGLTYNTGQQAWIGSLSLDGLPRGPYTMVIEASNSGGQTAQVSSGITYDKLPVLNLVQPVNYTIGQPDIPVKGECIDDAPGCIVTAAGGFVAAPGLGFPVLLSTGTPFDAVVRPRDGTGLLTVRATDSTGRYVEVTRRIFVSSRGGLSIADTFQGTIVDIDAARALTFDNTVTPSVVRLYDRAANTNQIIWIAASADELVEQGFLTPGNGALFVVATPTEIYDPLLEWRGGALTQVASVTNALVVKGAWAAFYARVGPCCLHQSLFVRDLTTGTNIEAAVDAGGAWMDVAPDGRVIFMSNPVPHQLLEFNPNPPPGTTTQLTASAPLWSHSPRTDGINIAFLRETGDGTSRPSLVLRTQAGVEEVLATNVSSDPTTGYRVAGGWTAFTRAGGVWIREPDGTVRQVASRGYIEALDANGDLIFTTGAAVDLGSNAARYLAEADGTVREIGATLGKARFIDGAPVILAGNQLVEIQPQPSRAILAEGATGTFFSTDVAILNPSATPVPVTVRYFREGQAEISAPRTLPARSRTTIRLDEVPGLEGASVSTQVDAPPDTPLVVERLMSWDATGYGGHLGNAVDAPRREWYFAEGAQGFFSTFFLIANSGAAEAAVQFTFLVEQGAPVSYSMKVPPAARRTFYAGDLPELVNRSFATVIETDLPVVAERAMYFGDSPFWLGGHGSAGVRAPASDWFHAEGATGSLFDTFILLANPNSGDAPVTLTFITDSGVTVTRQKTVRARSRLTINIEDEAPELANVSVSTRVLAPDYPIVSERAMYWGTTGTGWREAHNSFGVTASSVKWGLAEGRAGGDRDYQTYVLVSNATETDAELKVTFIREDGTAVEKSYSAAAGARLNIPASALTELANSNFATIVESINGVPINVESAIYWNAGGVVWEAGGNTVATPIP